MTQLMELHRAIRELNELWQVCDDDAQCELLLEKRDALDSQAQQLANMTLQEGTPELDSARQALNGLSEQAISAKNEVNDIACKIDKTASVINKATAAITKIATLLS